MEISENVGKLLYFLKEKKEGRYSELLKALGLSSAGLTKILDKLVSKDLVLRELRPDRSVYYRLNESRMDEINKLINAYLEHEKKELKEKMEFVMHYIDFTDEEKKEVAELVEKLKKKLGV